MIDRPRLGRGEVFWWAVDAIVHHQIHLTSDRIMAQLVADTWAGQPPRSMKQMHAHLVSQPQPLIERTFEMAVFRCGGVTFEPWDGHHAAGVIIYRPIRADDGLTVAYFKDLDFKANSGSARVRWPDGVFDL